MQSGLRQRLRRVFFDGASASRIPVNYAESWNQNASARVRLSVLMTQNRI